MTEADTCRKFVVPLTDYTGDKVRSICPSTVELRAPWTEPDQFRTAVNRLQSLLYAA